MSLAREPNIPRKERTHKRQKPESIQFIKQGRTRWDARHEVAFCKASCGPKVGVMSGVFSTCLFDVQIQEYICQELRGKPRSEKWCRIFTPTLSWIFRGCHPVASSYLTDEAGVWNHSGMLPGYLWRKVRTGLKRNLPLTLKEVTPIEDEVRGSS